VSIGGILEKKYDIQHKTSRSGLKYENETSRTSSEAMHGSVIKFSRTQKNS